MLIMNGSTAESWTFNSGAFTVVNPSTTEDWNIMQAITYSGASRGADSDGDLLLDEREAELGTDPNNPDTDGDGFSDGDEVANGFDPLAQ